ncbi:Protein saal1 [Cichlidogyrus casuarinus]|uniref:Protein saal1 n=1 Tax=Cichlidogyrus casuarinus TaxID=1844966 RepID=A0ABD2PZQ7_9PLAT
MSNIEENGENPPVDGIKNEDTIGDTAYSKLWLYKLLMRVLREVNDNVSVENSICELDPGIEDELCILWDMTVDTEILCSLKEFDLVDIFSTVLTTQRFPRLTEICFGILANLAREDNFATIMCENSNLM